MTKFLDFNALATGTVVDNEFNAQGVTVSAIGGSNQAMIFDTDHPTGEDGDLATTNMGKVLIISEDGDQDDPDDNAGGGILRFDFGTPADVNRLSFLDLEAPAQVHFYNAAGQQIATQTVQSTGDMGQIIVDFDVANVARMDVVLNGSGAIDNLVFDTSSLDGVVEGDNENNVIDAVYADDPDGDCVDAGDAQLPGAAPNDDIIDAFGGHDEINGGAAKDKIYGGSGSDTIEGAAGDDIIYGDSNYAGTGAGRSVRESFEWSEAGLASGDTLGGFTQNTGNVDVTFSISSSSSAAFTRFTDSDQNIENIDGDGDAIHAQSSLANVLNGSGHSTDYQLAFSNAVEDVSFRINDIDGDGVVRVQAFDVNGTPIEVKLEGGKNLTLSDTDAVAGVDTADGNGGYAEDDTPEYALLVSIAGPVSRITIEHDQNGGGNSGINITDVYFDAPLVDDGEDGGDDIRGGAGNDVIYGEGGNDDISGGSGNDTIYAGRNADTVDGGEGNDTIFGGNGSDNLSGGAGDDVIDGGTGDDTIDGGAGNDRIIGATGDDTLAGGTGDDIIDGGNGGDDIMRGGDGSDLFLNANAGDTVDGGSEGSDVDVMDLTGVGRINIVDRTVDADGDSTSGTVEFLDSDGQITGTLSFTEIEEVIPCFTPGTLIATPKGERRIEDLKAGDRVITRDNGIQEIRWVGHRALSGEELARAGHLAPVLIRQGALGRGLPERDMMVSPNHRILVSNDKTALLFEESEVLVAAKHLTGLEGVDVVEVSWTTYIHLLFDQHEVILSDGAWTESFQPGDHSLAGVGNAQRTEILELFPELGTRAGMDAYTAARRSLKKHEAWLVLK